MGDMLRQIVSPLNDLGYAIDPFLKVSRQETKNSMPFRVCRYSPSASLHDAITSLDSIQLPISTHISKSRLVCLSSPQQLAQPNLLEV